MMNHEKFKDNVYGIEISYDNPSDYTVSFIYSGVDFIVKTDSLEWLESIINSHNESNTDNTDDCLKDILDKAEELGYSYYAYGMD